MARNRRPENRSLPLRWRKKHGAYYYRVPEFDSHNWDNKTEFRLGKTLNEAYRVWTERLESIEVVYSVSQLLDRYALEVVPRKAYKSQESNLTSIARIRTVFGHMPVEQVLPRHAYAFRDRVTQKNGATSANRDLEVLSHILSKAVEWGVIDSNKLKGQVRKNSIKRRERYIEDWELVEAFRVASPFLRGYIRLKLLTGLRRGDLLRLTVANLNRDGLSVMTSKTQKKLTILWTSELQDSVRAVIRSRQNTKTPYLFPTREGKCYVNDKGQANGFDSLWQRYMKKLIRTTDVSSPFQEKDLRKKTASDMTSKAAQSLLGHSTADTTDRHYRLLGEKVLPHSLKE